MIILLSIIVPKQSDPYYQANITRRDLAILQEEKQRNNSRNTIVTIALPPSPPFLFLLSQLLSLLFTPDPLESEIPAKHLDHKPKALDLPDLTEPNLNT
jgi:hypothetical protein